jgi:hypothetical protein
METTLYFRRQAAFCLRLSDFCCDERVADHLRFQAADYHQKALRAEFGLRPDGPVEEDWSAAAPARH